MSKSIWNRSASIPISSLTYQELKQAMKDWAEGSLELERLLWNCYHNGIETSGCDSGNHGHQPYIAMYLTPEISNESIKRMLVATEKFGHADVQINFGGNPMSGPNWYRDFITFTPAIKSEADKFYEELDSAISSEGEPTSFSCFARMLELYDFLNDKDSGLIFGMSITHSLIHELSFCCFYNRHNWKYFDALFETAGLKKDRKVSIDPHFMQWRIRTLDKKQFQVAIERVLNVFQEQWNLEIPDELPKGTSFNYRARLMRKKFGTDANGIKLMNDWINANNPIPNARKINYS